MVKKLIVSVFILLQIGLLHAEQPDSVYRIQEPAFPVLVCPVIAAASIGAFFLDEPVRDHVITNPSGFKKGFSEITDVFGEKTIVVPAVAGAYGLGRFVFKDPKLQLTAFQSAEAILATGLITEGIKISAGRARPFMNEGNDSFHPFSWSDDRYKSFPSGHASLAFAVFTPFAENYSRWLYLIPASVTAGRVFQDKHWVSDVLFGSFIGFISGYMFAHNENIQLLPGGVVVKF